MKDKDDETGHDVEAATAASGRLCIYLLSNSKEDETD